jgi:hypothetical protein
VLGADLVRSVEYLVRLSSPAARRWIFAVTSSSWCRSKAGLSERMRGIEVKLCRGGGQGVAHSRERPQPQGSFAVTFGARREVMITLMKKRDRQHPRTNEPDVGIVFSVVQPSAARWSA